MISIMAITHRCDIWTNYFNMNIKFVKSCKIYYIKIRTKESLFSYFKFATGCGLYVYECV